MTAPGGRAAQGFSFRALTRDDAELVLVWRSRDHVRPWWGALEDLESEYFDPDDPTEHFVALLDGTAVGLVQCCRWSDYPGEAAVIGAGDGELGVDYLLGDSDLTGKGVGPAMLKAFLGQVVSGMGGVRGVRIDVAEANRRSWRCLEKLGFRRVGDGVTVAGEPGPHFVYLLTAPSLATLVEGG